jgi:hypothetical protein
LTPTAARVFGLVAFQQHLPMQLLDCLRSLLLATSHANILAGMVAAARASKSVGIALLTNQDREATPSLFQRLLMSPVDFNAYSATSIRGQYFHPNEYWLGAYLQSGDIEQESVHNQLEMTMR